MASVLMMWILRDIKLISRIPLRRTPTIFLKSDKAIVKMAILKKYFLKRVALSRLMRVVKVNQKTPNKIRVMRIVLRIKKFSN